MEASTMTAPRRPGRPRLHPTPRKLGIRFDPDLFKRMDSHLRRREPETTQRAFIERAVARELDDPNPSPEGASNGRHHEGGEGGDPAD